MKFAALICLEQFLSPPHTQAEVQTGAKAIIDIVTHVALQEESTHSACARVWSCDCPELPRLASAGDTIITPSLLNHGHYSKGNMPNMLQQSFCWARWAWFNLLRCWIFPAALEAPCPAVGANMGSKAVCREEHQAWLSGKTLWAAPAQPFCKGLRKPKPAVEKEGSGFSSSLRSCEDMVVLTGQVEVNTLHQIYTKWNGEVLRWSTWKICWDQM